MRGSLGQGDWGSHDHPPALQTPEDLDEAEAQTLAQGIAKRRPGATI